MKIPPEMLDKNLQKSFIHSAIMEDPETAIEFLEAIVYSLQKHKEAIDKKNSNIWLIVKNIKPEYLTEIKKLIVPEVFTNLGLD